MFQATDETQTWFRNLVTLWTCCLFSSCCYCGTILTMLRIGDIDHKRVRWMRQGIKKTLAHLVLGFNPILLYSTSRGKCLIRKSVLPIGRAKNLGWVEHDGRILLAMVCQHKTNMRKCFDPYQRFMNFRRAGQRSPLGGTTVSSMIRFLSVSMLLRKYATTYEW
jgi:hypothetical protein